MTSGAFRLNDRVLLDLAKRRGIDNKSQLQRHTTTTYMTLHRYMSNELSRLDADVLISILIDGLGMTKEQVENMRLGDVIQLVLD